jgi:hypothetical protein
MGAPEQSGMGVEMAANPHLRASFASPHSPAATCETDEGRSSTVTLPRSAHTWTKSVYVAWPCGSEGWPQAGLVHNAVTVGPIGCTHVLAVSTQASQPLSDRPRPWMTKHGGVGLEDPPWRVWRCGELMRSGSKVPSKYRGDLKCTSLKCLAIFHSERGARSATQSDLDKFVHC